MLDHVDYAVSGFLASQFPGFLVCWGPPEASRTILSAAQIKINGAQNPPLPNPNNSVGIPGMTIFRTATTTRTDATNIPMGNRGWANGTYGMGVDLYGNPVENELAYVLTRPVKAEYTITAYTKTRTDLNTVERGMYFSDIYRAVTTTIEGNTNTWPILRDGDPQTTWTVDNKTGEVLWYCTTQKWHVFTVWAQSNAQYPIHSIVTSFEDFNNGSPILLETITEESS